MTHFTWEQVPQLVAALVAAVSAFVAAWKSHQTGKTAEAIEWRQINQIYREVRPQPIPAVPASEAPGMGIQDALRYWDLISKLKAVWSAVKGQPVGVMGSLPIIKGVKIDGRKADLGPTPIVFR